jgi:hypothetical protein
MVISPVGYGISTLAFARKCHRYRFLSRHQTCADWSYRDSVEQSVTLAVVASKKGLRIRFASVNLSVTELLTRVNAQPGGKRAISLSSASSADWTITCRIPGVYYRGLQFIHAAPYDLRGQGVTIVHCG